MDKEEVLNEVLRGIGQAERLGIKRLDCEDISTWGFDEVSHYVITELDKLNYKLFSLDIKVDNEYIQPTGLRITWE